LTTLLDPKLTDGFNHLFAPNRRHAQASVLGTVVGRRVIVKYPGRPPAPNSTLVTLNGTIVPQKLKKPVNLLIPQS
jgi:hypothetical protein